MSRRYTGVLPLDHRACPVTADLDAYLAEREGYEVQAEQVGAKLDELMESQVDVAGALDALMGESDVDTSGNSLFGNDLAAVLLASDVAFGAEAIRYFVRLREQVRQQLRPDAESLVESDLERSGQDYADSVADAREASANYRELGE